MKINKSHLAIIGAAVCYSFIGVFIKLIGDGMSGFTISFFRVFFGLVFVAMLLPIIDGKHMLHPKKKDIKHFVGMGFVMATAMVTFNTAYMHAPITNVALLVNSYVIFTAVLAYFLLKEKLSLKEGLLMLTGMVGIAIMVPFQSGITLGNGLGLASGLTGAAVFTYMRYCERDHTIGTVFWFFLFATLFLLPFLFIYGVGNMADNILWLVLLGVICSGMAYLLLAFGMEKTDAQTSGLLVMITATIASIFLAWLIFNEELTLRLILGGIVLITAGILLEKEKESRVRITVVR